jgi:hypothetical protein
MRKRPLVRRRQGWEDNIQIDLTEIEWGLWTGFMWLRRETSGGLL